MKKYKVLLSRDYIVEIKAENENEAKEFAEFFVSFGSDSSSKIDHQKYDFEIERIGAVTNNAFEVEEI